MEFRLAPWAVARTRSVATAPGDGGGGRPGEMGSLSFWLRGVGFRVIRV